MFGVRNRIAKIEERLLDIEKQLFSAKPKYIKDSSMCGWTGTIYYTISFRNDTLLRYDRLQSFTEAKKRDKVFEVLSACEKEPPIKAITILGE